MNFFIIYRSTGALSCRDFSNENDRTAFETFLLVAPLGTIFYIGLGSIYRNEYSEKVFKKYTHIDMWQLACPRNPICITFTVLFFSCQVLPSDRGRVETF